MKMIYIPIMLALLHVLSFSATAQNSTSCGDTLDCGSSWLTLSTGDLDEVFQFAEEYKLFVISLFQVEITIPILSPFPETFSKLFG